MKKILVAVIILLAIPASATAAASWSAGDPGFRWCVPHGPCTTVHRVFGLKCGGWLWQSPRPFYVPPWARDSAGWRQWCEAFMPEF